MNRTAAIGFTGTTRGLTPEQRATLKQVLAELATDRIEFRHGDCVGADQQAADLAHELGYRIVGHPAIEEDGRAYTSCDELIQPRESAARNRDIVEASDLLIGCPAADQEWPGSGTWYTINYARDRGAPVLVLSPSGRILDDTAPTPSTGPGALARQPANWQ